MAERGILGAIAEWLAPSYIADRVREATEPVGDTVDPDDNLYRRLTGTARDINPIAQDRAQAIALYLWRTNPMAHRLTEMVADFVIGDGLTISAVEKDVQEVCDEFWQDPAMNLEVRHRDLVRDQSIYGELALRIIQPAKDTPTLPRLGYIVAERIKGVELDKDNAFRDETLVLKPKDAGSEDERLAIASWDDESERWQGDAFYFAINRVLGQSRGTPDLLAVADYMDGYDQLLFNSIERSALINAFVWDVTLTGAIETQVQQWVEKHGSAPPPGSVRAHNDKELWQAVSPTLGASETVELGRATKNMALGGMGAPEAWFAEGDSANRATLSEQGDPTYRMIARRQADTAAFVTTLLDYVIDHAISTGRLPKGIDRTVSVAMPEPSTKDISKLSAALAQATNALIAAQDADYISQASARRVFLQLVSGLGTDLNAEEEEEAIEDEREEEEANAPTNVVPGEELPAGPGRAPLGVQPSPGQPVPAGNGPVPPGNGQTTMP